MEAKNAHLVVDVGTGNVRVALISVAGEILFIKRDNIVYDRDAHYEDALEFSPMRIWEQIMRLIVGVTNDKPDIEIVGITASSQREGVVLLDKDQVPFIGFPNHDHRGRAWEDRISAKERIAQLAGRYPSSLFSAFKLYGLREKRPELFEKTSWMLSISDWVQFMFSGVLGYEHSQASETLLYDVARMEWSDELCGLFGIEKKLLPPLRQSGEVLGNILPAIAEQYHLNPNAKVVVGGADTQLAIKSTQPTAGDIVLVSGTTTPIVKIIEEYKVDEKMRTWTGRHIEEGEFVLEANAGVTGLNYQNLKDIFYPNEGYDVIERELENTEISQCVASLGSLVADEYMPLTRGGFIFNVPLTRQLTRSSFVQATLWDIACSIKRNYEVLCEVVPYQKDYVWACGGGFQSDTLSRFIANLIGKKILIRKNFSQASVAGAGLVCNEALGFTSVDGSDVKEIGPEDFDFEPHYREWKNLRSGLKHVYGGK